MKEKKSELAEPTLMRQFGMFALVLSTFTGLSAAGVGIGWYLWKSAGFPWWTILITALLGLYGASLQVLRYQRTLQSEVKR